MSQCIRERNRFTRYDKLFVAVSGGVDSVVLCHILKTLGYAFEILHCNFKLRGEESERDEKFVRQLALRLQVSVVTKSFETKTYADKKKLSIQEAARELRYAWFKECTDVAEDKLRISYDPGKKLPKPKVYLLTAHHLDDDIETMVFNFFKGTGIHGLRGMPVIRDFIARPLLRVSRQQILNYAEANQLDWVEDSSNAEIKYSRNFIRHQLLGEVEKIIPQAKNNLASNLVRFNDAAALYEESIERYRKKLLTRQGSEWMIPVEKLRLSHPVATILYELLKPFGFASAQIPEALKLMDSDTGKWICSKEYRLLRNRNWLLISALSDEEFHPSIIEREASRVEFNGGYLLIQKNPDLDISGDDSFTALLDSSGIRFPLILRRWKTGDYFYPLGMKKKKKLSRFFIDQKLSKTEKEQVLVIESDQRILWVVGHRIDERFKITDKVSSALKLKVVTDTRS